MLDYLIKCIYNDYIKSRQQTNGANQMRTSTTGNVYRTVRNLNDGTYSVVSNDRYTVNSELTKEQAEILVETYYAGDKAYTDAK